MATRFYMDGSTAADISPTPDSGWEQTGQVQRFKLIYKNTLSARVALANTTTRTVPITTTQDILGFQFISDPIPGQRLIGNFSYVSRVLESATTANVTLALVLRLLSNDGTVSRGTLFSVFGVDTEFAATAATRIQAASAMTALTAQSGDRLCLEVGGHALVPTAATTYTMRFGTSAATDFALTSALTTDLNPWCETSTNIWTSDQNNYQFARVGNNMGTTERIR